MPSPGWPSTGRTDRWTDPWVDRTLQLLRQGYEWLPGLLRDRGADAAEVRLLGRMATCVTGREGVRLFYDTDLIRRNGALPGPLQRTLFGRGPVHGLDGPEHLHRKGQFLSLLGPDGVREITALAEDRWRLEARRRWAGGGPVDVFDEALCGLVVAACTWSGVPDGWVDRRLVHDLACIVDGFGSAGVRHVEARLARRRVDRWSRSLVDGVRSGRVRVPGGRPLERIACDWDDPAGRPLDTEVAATELVNLLRPTVAVAWPVTFATIALRDHPDWSSRLRDGEDGILEGFVHEVRRVYPFVPMLAGRAGTDFEWRGLRVPAGRRVVLDVYGTLHDPRIWPEPDRFRPDRHVGSPPDPFALIPQGGGDVATGHRCPGEALTVELLEAWVRLLCSLRYEVCRAARVPLGRIPARPATPVLLRNVRVPSQAGRSGSVA